MIKAVYIHIPFCENICSYCDFCKMYYNSDYVDKYLETLKKEIKDRYNNDIIETIYVGGGTPSCLNIDQLKKLCEIITIFKTCNLEYTFECNIENIDEEKIKLLKSYGVNRLSIGVQSFNEKYLKFLNRKHNKQMVIDKINMIKKYITNINIDLIYALPNQTIEDLKNDLDCFLKLEIPHISTYSLIIEKHTKLYINNTKSIDEELDFQMYNTICDILIKNGYHHYEISNFAKEGYQSRHNLTYWNNDEYYGFGVSSSGYINNIRYDNTKSLNHYINSKYVLNEINLTFNEKIENEFILGLRKIKGINKNTFYRKYNLNITDIDVVKRLINDKKLIYNGKYLYLSKQYIYTSNDILINFLDVDYEKVLY